MSKKFGPGRCVHCLKYFDDLTSDHVFPVAWYPDSTPANIEKWQIPACSKCNREFGRLEDDLLSRFGLCLSPAEISSLGVSTRALRSINPDAAKNERDRMHRIARRAKLRREFMEGDEIPRYAVLPWFEGQGGSAPSEQGAIFLSAESLERFAAKLVRGIFYVRFKQYIELTHKIRVFPVLPEDAERFWNGAIRDFGKEEHRGPGIRIGLAVTKEDSSVGLLRIDIWDRVRMYAAVQRADEEESANGPHRHWSA